MKVLLTGATGYIGSAVTDALRRAGHEVTGLARSDEAVERLKERGIQSVRGDLTDTDILSKASSEADAVIHTALPHSPEAPAVDRNAVEAILNALEGTNKPFIYTSGIWVYGSTGDTVATEDTPLNPTPMVAWRPYDEKLALEGAARGVRSVVIRPGIVYGGEGGIVGGMIQEAREKGIVRFVGTGDNRWPQVHVEDLAELYVLAIERAPAGTLINGTSRGSVRVRDVAEAASRAGGAGGRVEAWPLEEARKKLGAYADALALDQQVSGKRAEELLGWKAKAASLPEFLERG
ncbi:MAG: SDR family oxidoreductase [Pyrinomonadaceae bacterium]|nr:SDR family oxidoreductase [Pyrinomonadaceae bacterium]